jgi:hypothetical protein
MVSGSTYCLTCALAVCCGCSSVQNCCSVEQLHILEAQQQHVSSGGPHAFSVCGMQLLSSVHVLQALWLLHCLYQPASAVLCIWGIVACCIWR